MKTLHYLISGAILLSLIGGQITYASIFCIGGGGLSITSVPSGLDFGDVEVSTNDTTLALTVPDPVYFEDMRGVLIKKAIPRFSIYVTVTDLIDSATGDSIDLTNMSIKTDSNDTIEIEDCSPRTVTTPVLTDLTTFTDSDDDGTSDNTVLVMGRDPFSIIGPSLFGEEELELEKLDDVLKGKLRPKWIKFLNIYVGKFSFEPEMELNIPAYTTSGNYRTTLTFTII
jgi:hypothetical protein